MPNWAKERAVDPKYYTKMPSALTEGLFRKASRIGIAIIQIVWNRTVGSKDRPSWASVPIEELARIINCDEDSVRKEIEKLAGAGMLRVRRHGLFNFYQVNVDAIAAAPDIEPRVAPPKKPVESAEEARPELPPAESFVLTPRSGARPIPLKAAVRGIEFISECTGRVEVCTIWGDDNSALRFVLRDVVSASNGASAPSSLKAVPPARNGGGKSPIAGLQTRYSGPDETHNSGSADPVLSSQALSNQQNPTSDSLRNMLNGLLRSRCGPVDERMLSDIAGFVKCATLDDLRQGIESRVNGKRKVSWGLVRLMIDDIEKAAFNAGFACLAAKTSQEKSYPSEVTIDQQLEARLAAMSRDEWQMRVAEAEQSFKKEHTAAWKRQSPDQRRESAESIARGRLRAETGSR
jgi:hypothetical protein